MSWRLRRPARQRSTLATRPPHSLGVSNRFGGRCALLAVGATLALGQPSAILRVAPQVIALGGGTLTLSVQAWRSFQPLAPRQGDPLIVAATLHGRGVSIPVNVHIDSLYVLSADARWTAAPREQGNVRTGPVDALTAVARHGPPWAPGVGIDVVARVLVEGHARFLRAPRVVLARVD